MSERVAVLGAGAIGGTIGAYLARAAHDVTLIDMWPENVSTIRDRGLRVTAMEEDFTVELKAEHLGQMAAVQNNYDIVFLCVKSYDTRWACEFVRPHLAPGGFLVTAQNGINEETIAEVIGWSRVVGCVVTIGAGMYEPGHVHRTNKFDRHCFSVGEPSGVITPRVRTLTETLRSVGGAKETSDLWGQRWTKLAVNCMANAVCGMAGIGNDVFWVTERTQSLAIRIANEVLDVADAVGVTVESVLRLPAADYRKAANDDSTHKRLQDAMTALAPSVGAGRPSLAQDVLKSRKTEVDALNGYVVEKARELGIATPVNDAILDLTHQVESGALAPSVDVLDRLPS